MRCLFVLLIVNGSLWLAVSARAQVSPDSKDVSNASPADLPVPVKSSAGEWGYQDKSGTYVIPPQFDRAEHFSEGLAVVQLKHKFGYIDSTGRLVIPVKFTQAAPFSEGLALVYTTWGMNILGAEEGYTFFVRGVHRSQRQVRDQTPPRGKRGQLFARSRRIQSGNQLQLWQSKVGLSGQGREMGHQAPV